jgi:hypothetical protein
VAFSSHSSHRQPIKTLENWPIPNNMTINF